MHRITTPVNDNLKMTTPELKKKKGNRVAPAMVIPGAGETEEAVGDRC
jgi:hypothetical protein